MQPAISAYPAQLLAQRAHRRLVDLLRGLGALLQFSLLGLGLLHPVGVIDSLDVEDHLQHLARLDQLARRLHVVRLQFDHLGEDRGRLLPLLALVQRGAEAVVALGPVGLEVDGERCVLQRELVVLVLAFATLVLAVRHVRQRAVAQDLVVGGEPSEARGVVLDRLVVPPRLHGLVAQLLADRGGTLKLIAWDLIERLDDVLALALGALVPPIHRVLENLSGLVIHRGCGLRRHSFDRSRPHRERCRVAPCWSPSAAPWWGLAEQCAEECAPPQERALVARPARVLVCVLCVPRSAVSKGKIIRLYLPLDVCVRRLRDRRPRWHTPTAQSPRASPERWCVMRSAFGIRCARNHSSCPSILHICPGPGGRRGTPPPHFGPPRWLGISTA